MMWEEIQQNWRVREGWYWDGKQRAREIQSEAMVQMSLTKNLALDTKIRRSLDTI
jgi:hypothetical protein